MLKPVSLTCGHSGCKACIEQVIKCATGATPKCAVCRAEMPHNLAVNICLEQIVGKLPMRCASAGCQWRGTMVAAEEHERGCAEKIISCHSEGCDYSARRQLMTEHENFCTKRKATCRPCGKVLTVDSLPRHEQETCPFLLKDCPLACGKQIPRSVVGHVHCS